MEAALKLRGALEAVQAPPVRDGVTASPLLDGGEAQSVPWSPSQGVFDATRVEVGTTQHQGPIAALDAVGRELVLQALVGRVALGGHHDPAGALVQAVHDAWPLLAADAREPPHREEEAVDQGAVGVPLAGVDDHAGWLDHHHQVRVLVEDLQPKVLRLQRRRAEPRHPHLDRGELRHLE